MDFTEGVWTPESRSENGVATSLQGTATQKMNAEMVMVVLSLFYFGS